ncbi:Cro/CI family transcriptional regulator [Klebsiella michiganensis]|uniref:Cro/CI family transcriptional regulator n=1 Tax=Klebsiella michiganensis TaxID=1134687 RepID=UPI0018C6A2D2|nr:Cro/CI family transcriptional regulator [Klebsiella michiganensis]MBG2620369.1 helix-turn-helix domain-containing protein [Klebsiella michiganensis]MBG2634455.1 helix-turn-helix domain-containing protein [Klebsiella michiganensis]MDQ2563775.1 Cro/CI family transcriptional regulator [Klebsiella michiganensis]HBM3085062.1 helix-turn-helix domain-containing protein [Klebsiella michiganensis]
MKKSIVVEFYGSQRAVAEVLGVSDQSISAWREIIPERAALKLERITKGSLKYDASLYVGRRQHPAEA